ncbi:MAG: GDYXXLXY domain-containing protein [Leptonema sp. (in: bacteria)]
MKREILFFLFPLGIIIFYVFFSYYRYAKSESFVYFPIQSYDPRDLIKGQYLEFNVIYADTSYECDREQNTKCGCIEFKEDKNFQIIGFISNIHDCNVTQCQPKIQLKCRNQVYTIPHHKYFLSEEKAKSNIPISENSYILLTIDKNGKSNIRQIFVYDTKKKKLIGIQEYLSNK